MSSTDSSTTASEQEQRNILWEHGDSENDSSTSILIEPTLPSSQAITSFASQSTTTGLNSPMEGIDLSSSQSTTPFPSQTTSAPCKRGGRPHKGSKFRGNKYTSRNVSPILLSSYPSHTIHPKSKRIQYTIPRHGYTSKLPTPFPSRQQKTMFKTSDEIASATASKPSGMRLLDVSILADAISQLLCSSCGKRLSFFESAHLHGWHTTFYIKCQYCHQLFAEFPSSKPMIPDVDNFVNVKPTRPMNEVTMRSVLAVHCSGFSWRDLHKFSTIFNMPAPPIDMPPKYLNKIEAVVKSAVEELMQGAADELHQADNTTPSSVPDCIDIPVSFDSSWKTRGYVSNLGFGSAISASTKKVLDYALFNRICEKCSRWPATRREEHPEEHQKWYDSHKANCRINHTGSSQSMEPAAATLIWSRSVESRKLCYTTFIGDGDSKSYQQVSKMNPYDGALIRKEECLAHVSKRLKQTLRKKKKNTRNKTYVQHHLVEPKAEYISSNYSTVVRQHRGQSPADISNALNIFLSHVSGKHTDCPKDSWCRWKQTFNPPPPKDTNYSEIDIEKIKEVFNIYASEEFCSHLTLGMTQNANESLHNTIWCLCPKAKYVSPQSVTISTAVAVTLFNEGELSIYGFMRDLQLGTTYLSFRSIIKREETKRKRRSYFKKANLNRRVRRQKLAKERREKDLLRKEGGRSYQSSSFGSETFSKPVKRRPSRARTSRPRGRTTSTRSRGRRISTTKSTRGKRQHADTSDNSISPVDLNSPSDTDESTSVVTPTTSRSKRIATTKSTRGKRQHADTSDDSISSMDPNSPSDTDESTSGSSEGVCDICEHRQPPPESQGSISKLPSVEWIQCDICDSWFHVCCTELPADTEVSSKSFKCYHCQSSKI